MTDSIKSINDLKVYNKAYEMAMIVFEYSKEFPKNEMYSLTDQVIRASRSVAANIREGYARRSYEKVFSRHLSIALGSLEETRTWLKFSKDCNYLSEERHIDLEKEYDQLSAMIYKLNKNWKKF
jgi:four helix bundle protein